MKSILKDITTNWSLHGQAIVPIIIACVATWELSLRWDRIPERVALLVCIGLMIFSSYIHSQVSYFQGEIAQMERRLRK